MNDFVDDFLLRRKDLVLLIDEHVEQRMAERQVAYKEIETTVLRGLPERGRCREYKHRHYDKIVLFHYFGREPGTVRIVLLTDGLRALVKTVYPKVKGRLSKR
jgi:hypothetical protein